MLRAGSGREDFVGQAARGPRGVRGRLLDIGRRRGRRLGELDQLDVEHQHAFRPALLSLVGERFGNPEPPFFAGHHQLHAFGPSGDDAVERERRPALPAETELSNILPSVVQPV